MTNTTKTEGGTKTAKPATTVGASVVINHKHWGAKGSTGRVLGNRRIAGRLFWRVCVTGGAAAGLVMNFLPSELSPKEVC